MPCPVEIPGWLSLFSAEMEEERIWGRTGLGGGLRGVDRPKGNFSWDVLYKGLDLKINKEKRKVWYFKK